MANAPRRAQDMSRYVKMMHQDMASYGNLVLARCLQDMSGKGDLKWATLSCEAMWKSRCVRFINSLVWTPTRPHGPWWTLVDRVLWKFDEAVLAFLCRNCRFIHFHSLSTFGKTQFLCIAFTEERLKEAKQILQAEITMGLENQVWRTAKVTIWPRDKRMIALTVG